MRSNIRGQSVGEPRNDKTNAIIGEKNCFLEIQKRSFYLGMSEAQDIYEAKGSFLFAPRDRKDEMIAHEAELLPQCSVEENRKRLARADLTEEALDDWVAQGMNRSIQEILDPKKKFQIPVKPID